MFTQIIHSENGLLLIIEFFLAAGVVLFSGTKLARWGDVLGATTGLGGSWIGVMFLAMITSTPELVATITSAAMHVPNMGLGNLFGSNVFNILIIGILDLVQGPGPIMQQVNIRQILPAGLGILLTSLAAFGLAASFVFPAYGGIIGFVVGLSIIVLWSMGSNFIFKMEQENFTPKEDKKHFSRGYVIALFTFYAFVIVLGGIWIVGTTKQIAIHRFIIGTNTLILGETFAGTIILACVTSLPELVVSVSAFRLGAVDMAVANLFGSNTFNMLLIPLLQIAMKGHSVFVMAEPYHLIPALLSIILTSIAIIGMMYRSKKSYFYLGWDAMLIFIFYFLGNYIFFKVTLYLQ